MALLLGWSEGLQNVAKIREGEDSIIIDDITIHKRNKGYLVQQAVLSKKSRPHSDSSCDSKMTDL